MKKNVWPKLRISEDNEKRFLSAAHQHNTMSVCADCGRTFRTPIGLFSHKGTHRSSADLTNNTSTWGSVVVIIQRMEEHQCVEKINAVR